MENFQLFFSVHETGGSPTRPDPENRVVIKTLETQVIQFILGCECRVSRGIVVLEQDALAEPPRRFSSKCPSVAPGEMSNTQY
jgi:hypothetical protein